VQIVRPRVHAEVIERLWRAAGRGRLPHALLFEGRGGIGKYQAAKWFAQGLLCATGPGSPCGDCGPCRRVLSGGERGNHPDLFVLDHEDPLLAEDFARSQQIRIGRIAYRPEDAQLKHSEYCLERFLELCRAERGQRPVLIREAQRMNAAAQNALLKTLEEPREGTVLVLESQRPAQLLTTIRSRCVRIRFQPLSVPECEAVLVAGGLEAQRARDLARVAGGSPGLALELERRSLLEMCAALLAVALGERSPLEVAPELWELPGEFPGGTPTARERERARSIVDLTLMLLADARRLAAGAPPERLAHGPEVAALAARLGENELRRRTWRLFEVRADIERNLTPGALIDRVLLLLAAGTGVRLPVALS